MALTPAELGSLRVEEFVARLGGIYEKSPWVAERAHAAAPFTSLTQLHSAMAKVVDDSTDEEKLQLLRAHPDLAGKAAIAKELTAESNEEQAKAGLDQLTPEEMAQFMVNY